MPVSLFPGSLKAGGSTAAVVIDVELLDRRRQQSGQPTLLRHVILAAPDVRAEIFSEQAAPVLYRRAGLLTLYASSRDRALQASQRLHRARRAGQANPVVVLDSMDTVDASAVDTDLIGHGYFAENKAVMDDMFMLIRFDAPARMRNLRTEVQGSGVYYVLK
jgi:esterase/lipase superfamily enzyme